MFVLFFWQKLLVKAPGKRMSADDACAHPWITKHRQKITPAAGGGGEPVAQAMASRGGQDTGAPSLALKEEEESNPLDPELVRRLRKFAVSFFFFFSKNRKEKGFSAEKNKHF